MIDNEKTIEKLKAENRRLKRKVSNYNTMRFITELQNADGNNIVERILSLKYKDKYINIDNYIICFLGNGETISINKKSLDDKLKEVEVLGDSIKKKK